MWEIRKRGEIRENLNGAVPGILPEELGYRSNQTALYVFVVMCETKSSGMPNMKTMS